MQCPFVYADGHRCAGTIHQARAYGKRDSSGRVSEQDIRKIRLWCSEKGDHAGVVSSFDSKLRMEFYPDELHRTGNYVDAIKLCENVDIASAA